MTTDAGPEQASTTPPSETGGDIVARAGTYYRNTRYIMFILLVGMGCWFLYDGYVKYPRENQIVNDLKMKQDLATKSGDSKAQMEAATELKGHEYHNDSALLLQHVLGFALPPIGLLALLWALHRSRGEYRLSGTKLSVPGHPTIDLSEIKSVNNDLWDRKGIVWLDYATADGQSGEIVMDDFIYDRPPTDKIHDRIAALFGLDSEDDEDEDDEDEEETEEQSEETR